MAKAKSKDCQTLEVLSVSRSKNKNFCTINLEPPSWKWTAGQFVMLRPLGFGVNPIAARPFSISGLDKQGLRLFIQVVGRGTEDICSLQARDKVDLWGPLGNGFSLEHNTPTLIVAGGVGIAPFVSLVCRHPKPENLEMIFGHSDDLENYPFQELAAKILAWNIQEEAPNFSRMNRALKIKIQGYAKDGMVLACGPTPFLQVVQEYANTFQARAQLLLETSMFCGVGACLGCAVKTSSGMQQACTQGPVFWSQEIQF